MKKLLCKVFGHRFQSVEFYFGSKDVCARCYTHKPLAPTKKDSKE